eukprot:gene2437-2475_t
MAHILAGPALSPSISGAQAVSRWPLGDKLAQVAAIFALGTALLVLPMVVFLLSPALGLLTGAVLAFCLVNYGWKQTPAVLIFATMFQNLFVSFLSPMIDDIDTFNKIRGFTFLYTVIIWLVLMVHFFKDRVKFPEKLRKLIYFGLICLVAAAFYAAIGFVFAGSSAVISTRNIISPILLFQICLVTSFMMNLNISLFLVCSYLFVFCASYIELLNRPLWMSLTNADKYWTLNFSDQVASGLWEKELKLTGFVYHDIYDIFRVSLFNSSYFDGVEILRIHGPNAHAISFGYSLAFGALFLYASGHRLISLLALPLLIFASAKGAMIEIVFVIFGLVSTRLFGARTASLLMAGLLAVYIAFTFLSGMAAGDYHILGLLGGLKGFITNPVGHGIGVGGNLAGTISIDEWQQAQANGIFDGAVESAIGVLLYQMGLAALLIIGFYAKIITSTWQIYTRTGLMMHGIATWGVLSVLINGLFQEEALFSPLAMGLMVCFSGMVIGSAMRVKPAGDSRHLAA